MMLEKKINASGIAEVVIAVSIIAICVGLFSILFIRTSSNQLNYLEIKQQSELETQVFESLNSRQYDSIEKFQNLSISTKEEDEKIIRTWNSSRGITLWIQEFNKSEIQ